MNPTSSSLSIGVQHCAVYLNMDNISESLIEPVKDLKVFDLPQVHKSSVVSSITSTNLLTEEEGEEGCSEMLPNEELDPWVLNDSGDTWVTRDRSHKRSDGGIAYSTGPVLIFRSSALASPAAGSPEAQERRNAMPARRLHVTYKALQAETKLLSKLLDAHGLVEAPLGSSDFNLLWMGSHPKPDLLRSLSAYQRVNHFPRSYELTRKDRLYKNIERMQHSKGFKNFDFIPQTFVMPAEFRDLCNSHYRNKGPWIIKPVASSRGRGIHIVNEPNQVPLEEPVVVAKYIGAPLLVGGHKCDLRLYIVVTSFDPLLVYLYEEGLVRFATVPYDNSPRQLWNPCMHLCNYSINKYHCDYVKSDDPTAEDVGHKWTLSALLRHLRSQGHDTAILMENIEDLIIKSLLSCAQSIVSACRMFVPHSANCFELYGFDILIDETLKPWLLEINLSPSLCCDTPLDVRLKSALVADMLTLVGIPAIDPMLRPTSNNSVGSQQSSTLNKTSSTIKIKNCRRVHSADMLNNRVPNQTGNRLSNSFSLSSEESRIVRMARVQFERRGGFVRIFPTADTWSKYSQYLDPVSGIPCCLDNIGTTTYQLVVPRNYNSLIHVQLFAHGSWNGKENSKENKLPSSTVISSCDRLDRYERALSHGHNEKIDSPTQNKTSFSSHLSHDERQLFETKVKNEVLRQLETGSKLTQGEARRAFSCYLMFILKRLSSGPCDKDNHLNLIIRFLQRASSQLKIPYFVKTPSPKLSEKDRTAVVAKQLGDFLYIYNRETELYSDMVDRPHHLPNKLFLDFLEIASETEIEEALILHMQQNRISKTNVLSGGLQVLMRCIPTLNSPSKGRITNTASRHSGKFSVRVGKQS